MGRPTRHRLGGRRVSEQTFLLPDLGEGLTEAEITEWKVNVGDTVAVDQVIVEVETAKAAVELPVPFAGIVVALHRDAGSTLTVGAPVITVASQHQPAASGNVLIGYGTGEPHRRRRRASTARPAAAPAVKVISPAVRKLARDNGIEVSRLSPTGACGVITRADVDRTLGVRAARRAAHSDHRATQGHRGKAVDQPWRNSGRDHLGRRRRHRIGRREKRDSQGD
jgi:2-oxoisovalerate dehydrogenase E2 component (dihydrolipoyl transacylase)